MTYPSRSGLARAFGRVNQDLIGHPGLSASADNLSPAEPEDLERLLIEPAGRDVKLVPQAGLSTPAMHRLPSHDEAHVHESG